MKIKEIVVPVSFSESSINALKFTIEYAKNESAGVYALHVLQNSLETENAIVAKLAEKIKNTQTYRPIVVNGDTASEIIHFSEKISSGLIVLSSTGAENETWGVSPVTSYIATKATVPVLIVPSQTSFKEVKNILIISEYSIDIIERLFSILNLFDRFYPTLFLLFIGKDKEESEDLLNNIKQSTNYNTIECINIPTNNFEKVIEKIINEKAIDLISFQGGGTAFKERSEKERGLICYPSCKEIPMLVFPELLRI